RVGENLYQTALTVNLVTVARLAIGPISFDTGGSAKGASAKGTCENDVTHCAQYHMPCVA
ncbi:MAG: hypothetical protein AAGA19_14625, partial [Pseudomonadota bacterium]